MMSFFDRFRGFDPKRDAPKVQEKSPEKNRRDTLLTELKDFEIITNQDRVFLLLVLEGLKSACDIQLVNPDRPLYKKEADYQDRNLEYKRAISKIEELLQRFRLPYTLEYYRDEGRYPCENAIFEIGKDEASLQASRNVHSVEEQGRVLGIPDTAISGFIDERVIENDSLPDSVKGSDYFHFIDFRLSEDHWQEELEFVKRRAEQVKQLAPELYSQIVSEGKEDQ